MAERILVVDDDERVLQGYHRALHNRFEIDVAQGGTQALQALERHGPYALLVADMRMPGMNGLELLQEVQRLSPDTIRIMLTGNLDQKTATDSVNQGQVFRFLTKPCPAEELAAAIDAGLNQYRIRRAEQDLLENTLTASVETLAGLLASMDSPAFAWAQEVKCLVRPLAVRIGLPDIWALEVAALMAPIGRVTLPPSLLAELASGRPPKGEARTLLDRVPEMGAKLLERIPRLEGVALMVRYQAKGFDGSGFPVDALVGTQIPEGARLLKVVGDFVTWHQARKSQAVALEELTMHARWYDPRMLDALRAELTSRRAVTSAPVLLQVAALRAGMVLAEDARSQTGLVVFAAGTRLGAAHLQLLANLADMLGLHEPLAIQPE